MINGKDSGGKRTSIQIYQATKNALDTLGKKGDTYDDIIRQLLEEKAKK